MYRFLAFFLSHLDLLQWAAIFATTPYIRWKKNSSKVPFVGTLNLCLKMPDTMQKTRNWSDIPGLIKRSKTVENWVKSNFVLFQQFFYFFSSHDDQINFLSFAMCKASQDKSVEYTQRVLCRNFFSTEKGVWAEVVVHCGRSRWLRKKLKISTWLYNYISNNISLGQIISQLFVKMIFDKTSNYLNTFCQNDFCQLKKTNSQGENL